MPHHNRPALALALLALTVGCETEDDPVPRDLGLDLSQDTARADTAPTPDIMAADTTAGAAYGQRCTPGQKSACKSGLVCVSLKGQSSKDGYCSAYCSTSKDCPKSPAGSSCAFSSGAKKLCGFVCDGANPHCPGTLGCSYIPAVAMYYCTGDPVAKCGNSKLEAGERCDGAALDNLSCKAFGFAGGTLACDSSCRHDTKSCSGSSKCKLPPRDCTYGPDCAKLEQMLPRSGGDGFKVYTLSKWGWLRRDTFMLVKYAAAAVNCIMPGSWPISLADGSDAYGATPKFDNGKYRHPPGSHAYGIDIDIAYYQTGQKDNDPREVCPHKDSGGVDQNHCTAAPDTLDARRSALLLGKFAETGRLRAMGVDGKIGPLLRTELAKLHSEQLITTRAHELLKLRMTWETTNTGKGWFLSHHHHVHVSTSYLTYPKQKSAATPPTAGPWLTLARPAWAQPRSGLVVVHPLDD